MEDLSWSDIISGIRYIYADMPIRQKKSLSEYRRRLKRRGVVRLEVHVRTPYPLARQVGKSSEVLGRREPLRLEAPHLIFLAQRAQACSSGQRNDAGRRLPDGRPGRKPILTRAKSAIRGELARRTAGNSPSLGLRRQAGRNVISIPSTCETFAPGACGQRTRGDSWGLGPSPFELGYTKTQPTPRNGDLLVYPSAGWMSASGTRPCLR